MDYAGRLREGGSLRLRLLGVMLVPLLALGVLAGSIVQSSAAATDAAADVRASVALVSAYSEAHSAVARESLTSLAQLVVSDEVTARTYDVGGIDRSWIALQVRDDVSYTRTTTDGALDRLRELGRRAEAAEVLAEVQALRGQADSSNTSVESLYSQYATLTSSLAAGEQGAAEWAVQRGLDPSSAVALTRLQRVSELVRAADAELLTLFGTRLPYRLDPDRDRLAWLGAWSTYERLSEEVSAGATQDVKAAWARIEAERDVDELDSELAAAARVGAGGEGALTIPQVFSLSPESTVRGRLLASLLHEAVHDVEVLTDEHEQSVGRRLNLVVIGSVLVVLAGLALLLLLERWVTRPLAHLAGAAHEIGEGRLVDLRQGGPREVRTVARALAAAVGSMRRIREQAETVARGDLDSPVLSEPLPGPLGRTMHTTIEQFLGVMKAQEQLKSTLAHQAAHDALTRLPNRAEALRLLGTAIAHRQRPDGVAVLFVDLDRFKTVNDTYGHSAGDHVLVTVAGRLRASCRPRDAVCRLGGDEFVVVLDPAPSEGDLLEVARRVVSVTAEPIEVGQHNVRIGASVGAAISGEHTTDASGMLHEADVAAYRAKAGGRGRVEMFDGDLREALAQQEVLEEAMRHALAQDEFVLHYQPVYDTVTRRLTGFEALIRWQRPGHGLVGPGEFIPVAEQSGLVCDIGRWTLRRATEDLAEWRRMKGRLGRDVSVAVNIAGRHLASPDFLGDVAEALYASGLEPERLVVELTETMLVDLPTAVERLTALRATSVQVAIDDFGTGYTSIAQLQQLPVDIVKIDRSFTSSADPSVLALIVSTARSLGLRVVGEGVETEVQMDLLRRLRCDRVQGFLLCRPGPLETVGAALPSSLTKA